ncbi:hypothetical protein [Polaromonas naphthalenivorans]|uniref:Uncharacterized protein n=1 Tax=Polaromonas naphthalenivorans (strain CJ2) TaxID=365044 RepID=A1VVN9_POLNA|nr:hypothetical protein [Polaromonas naphthalenivorans]ABM39717.1 hypothetical protein Pnap_4440 [Polaromonas naphthalenivorans CJ2]MDO8264463.1 hypothetical protein [Gallionella sp.]
MLLIVVTFLAGATWGPQVSMQAMPNPVACMAAMNAVAQTIGASAKSNLNTELLIQNDGTKGLKITSGVNQRIMASLACK